MKIGEGGKRATYYGQIDTYTAVKDYQRRGLCLRIFAVDEQHYDAKRLSSDEGVPVVALDVSYWQYCRSVLGDRWLTRHNRDEVDALQGDAEDRRRWYRFEVQENGARRDGYSYPAFSGEAPQFFELISAKPVEVSKSLELRTLPRMSTAAVVSVAGLPRQVVSIVRSFRSNGQWKLFAFHVGQGMCSLVTDGRNGVLLDVGAGTPVVRPRYLHDTAFKNELAAALQGLQSVDLVLSHADADHWRLLAWDPMIRSKIRKIFVPSGAKPIAFQDPAVIKKTFESGDLFFSLSINCELHILRSQPQPLNDNSDCLLAVFECAGKRALIGGDYVYRHYKSDGHAVIKALHSLEFDALVVPHHGDAASAVNVVSARPGAVAFFSAGTHQKYKHPRDVSRKAHIRAKFGEICDPNCADIVQRRLI